MGSISESKGLQGAFYLGLILALTAASSGFWGEQRRASLGKGCIGECIYVQVRGLEKAEGVYKVPRFTRLGDFLAVLRKGSVTALGDTLLRDWTCLDFPDPTGDKAPRLIPVRESVKYLLGYPMDLNRAEVRDLMLLPGIGPGLAKRIVQERRAKGAFGSPEDLSRVKGIPRKTLERIRNMVGVQEQNRGLNPDPLGSAVEGLAWQGEERRAWVRARLRRG